MPLYEYECEACGQRFEVIQKFSDVTEACRKCGKGPVRRLMSSPAIQFKGSGWYITDYAKKSGSESGGASSAKDGSSAQDAKPDAAGAKTDTAAKPDAAAAKSDSSSPSASSTTSTKE
jgi:putative FmdB family regulatory protein